MSYRGFSFGGADDGYEGYSRKTSTGNSTCNKHYESLGLHRQASQAEVKKGYLNAAKVHHPDKGGDADKFRQIQTAYETLNDPEKRRLYDLYGQKGEPEPSIDTSDLISMLFGGARRFGSKTASSSRPRQMEKVKASKLIIHISLEDVYNGHAFKIPHRRLRCCTVCYGVGGQKQATCTGCKGQGRIRKLTQLMPGMYQQSEVICDECSGKGVSLDRNNLCKECKGAKTIEQDKTLDVVVEKGIPNNHEIVLTGQGDEKPGYLAGDLIIIVTVVAHPDFERRGADLYMRKSITLLEALTGVKSSFTHLDGTVHNFESTPGDMINFTDKRTLYEMGLPFFHDSFSQGNLIIEFDVQMPGKHHFSTEDIKKLGQILPGKDKQMLIPGRPTTQLNTYRQEDLNSNPQGGNRPEQQSKDQFGGQRVGCGTQ